ncbi:MAG: cytochrome c, partial [Nitrospirota bacterium]|nr:cytochrome c [Nitrospirota bacterium]
RAKALDERAKAITAQLSSLGAGAQVEVASTSGGGAPASGDIIAKGKEQWELQECYNCHKLFGSGGKKRGPVLDNIGSLMTPEALREKILNPKSWMAEGFDKQYKKGKMPDKYRDLMFEEEIAALVAFLATLKDASVETPKPIKMN